MPRSLFQMEEKNEGCWELKLSPVKAYDAGIYKCVARNEFGFTISKCRLHLGGKMSKTADFVVEPDSPCVFVKTVPPGRAEPPESEQADESQIYVAWTPPKFTGNSPILCYKLEYKLPGEYCSLHCVLGTLNDRLTGCSVSCAYCRRDGVHGCRRKD